MPGRGGSSQVKVGSGTPKIGVTFTYLGGAEKQGYFAVKSLVAQGAGERAGLCMGDRVLAINGHPAFAVSREDFAKLASWEGKTAVVFRVQAPNGQERDVSIYR